MSDHTEAPVTSDDGTGAASPDTGTVSGPGTETGESGSTRTSGGPRRRRRGGRGRGRSSATKKVAQTEDGSSTLAARSSGTAGSGRSRSGGSATRAAATDVEALTEPSTPAGESGEAKPAGARRRRGARGRGGSRPKLSEAAGSTAAGPTESGAAADETAEASTKPASRSRRRRRKPAAAREKAAATGEDEPSLDDPPKAIAADEKKATKRRRAPASRTEPSDDGAASIEGPTRLRRGRAAGTRTTRPRTRRRREPVIVPRRITDKLMVITERGERDQIAILEEDQLVQHYVTRAGAKSMVGNIYLGRVQNVLPGMEAAFIDVGKGRNAVLYAGEVNYSPEELEGDTPPRIQDVLRSGQSVLVQVTKDPMGGKGARLTAQISVPGRYLVMVPNSNVFGISRRIPDEERKRLKAIAKKIRPDKHGVIVRTAAEGVTEVAMVEDLERAEATWKDIEKQAKKLKSKAPVLLYEEPELTVRVVRDLFTGEEFKELVTDSARIFETVHGYLVDVAPDLAEKVKYHEGKLSAFEHHHIEEQIHKALDRKVWLPSGGYLIIERTEAMTVIDVNTGKSVGKTNLEATVVNTNLEAAKEVARQLRLRDIGGIIIIDFIDMLLEKNKQNVTDTLKAAMAQDKTRSQVFEIGPLGLLEVTRKRVSGGLVESFSETCPTCEGRGILVNYEP